VAIRRPRPRPAQAQHAALTLTVEQRNALASGAVYVGSAHHTDIPKFGLKAAPRSPPKGYKAYPLVAFQVQFNIPFDMP
jgi:hypothetical protein